MCCFSGPIRDVSATRIFARWIPVSEGQPFHQCVVYQMNFAADRDLSMILPIPVPPASPEKAVQFIDLSRHEDFFQKLNQLFPVVRTFARAPSAAREAAGSQGKLEVVSVGSFEASFVPTVKDFSRLDERFRLPTQVWDELPAYKNWGFAVFKLKKDAHTVHPMAFTFPRASVEKGLFLPTVHIHDGKVHARADFDHHLYIQYHSNYKGPQGWEESSALPSSQFLTSVKGLIDRSAHVYRKKMHGEFKNADVWA